MANQFLNGGEVIGKLASQMMRWWQEIATECGVDLTGFDPLASLEERLAWAKERDLEVATIFCRSSVKHVDGIVRQAWACVECAASERVYCPPEFAWIEQSSGRQARPEGIDQLLVFHQQGLAQVMLIDNPSRLTRTASQGDQLLNELALTENVRLVLLLKGLDMPSPVSGTNG